MRKKLITKLRLFILFIIAAFITYEAYMHQILGGASDGSPSIHALCPYGGLESLYTIFTTGSFIDKVYSGTFSLFIITIILAIIFKRGFCGWLCPFGGIQEFLGRIGKKIFKKQFIMPTKIDRVLRYLKYPILILTAVMSWITASMWFSPYDPWAAYGHITEGLSSLCTEFHVGLIILVITIIGSILYDRFFCKYLCPMGGFLAIVSKISPFKIKRDKDLCIDCNLCSKACPVKIDVAKVDVVTSAECLNCQECTSVCPKEGALTNSFSFSTIKKNTNKIKPIFVGIGVLAIYFGGIAISAAVGKYELLPEPIVEGETIADVDTLKGYMTLSEISILLQMPLDEVYRKMDIPENISKDTPAKELVEYIPDFDFHTARELLAE